MAKLKLCIGAITDVGLQRVNNEDNFFVPTVPVKERDTKVYNIVQSDTDVLTLNDNNVFIAVCDGMGGHNAGEYASHMAVSGLRDSYDSIISSKKYNEAKESFDNLLGEINHSIVTQSMQNPDMRGMGCTICGLYFFENKYMPVNIGDSRIYEVKGSKLAQISVDHTDRTEKKGALTRYLGMPEEYGDITAEYGIKAENLTKKTRFLLCSDGLTDMVSDDDILYYLKNEKNPTMAASKLVDAAKKMGGIDNVTVVVIDAIPIGNAIGRAFKRPLTYLIAAAVLLAAVTVGGAMWYRNNIVEPETVVVGESLDKYNERITNANSVEELMPAIEDMMNVLKDNREQYRNSLERCKAGGVDTTEFEAKFNEFSEKVDGLSEWLNTIKGKTDATDQYGNLVNFRDRIQQDTEQGKSINSMDSEVKAAASAAEAALNEKNKAESKKNTGSSNNAPEKPKSSGGSNNAPTKPKSSGGSNNTQTKPKSSGGSTNTTQGNGDSSSSSTTDSSSSSTRIHRAVE